VATSAGVFGALLPIPTLSAFVIFVIAVAASGHISIGSMSAAVILPIISFWAGIYPKPISFTALIVCLLILYTHIPNLKRILAGHELEFKDGSQPRK